MILSNSVTFLKRVALICGLAGALSCHGFQAQVKVWESTITLPTYEEDLPDVNPPFELFRQRSFITYPYTTRENLTNRRSDKVWRTLHLENEYLKVTVLPDLGGRLYSCVDKSNGAEMFYANPSIKYAQVAFRGAWVALGIEFNFPVSHNWMTVSPVDFATVRDPDGSASIWVGNIDRPYGMLWRVALTLRPGSSLLEQVVTLYNRSTERHRFYWWNTSSVESWDDSHIIYPMELTAAHGYADIDTWPVDSAGYDLSRPCNHTRGFVSRFALGSREPFMGVYHPKTRAGMVHYADMDQAPAKKIWSWGWDAEGRDWRKALSDNNSAYLEIQAGLFRNQETYAFLEPQQCLRFREYYMPVREIGGFSRANPNGVLQVQRGQDGKEGLTVGVNLNREISGGKVLVREGAEVVAEEELNLRPSGFFLKTFPKLTAAPPYTVEVVDGLGRSFLLHTEMKYDYLPKSEYRLGPQQSYRIPPAAVRSEGDFLEEGKNLELLGKLLPALECYKQGLLHFQDSFVLNKAAGRLSVQLKRYAEAIDRLSRAQLRTNNDPEVHYYLGNAWMGKGDWKKAQVQWEGAVLLPGNLAAAKLQLGKLSARQGDMARGLRLIQEAIAASPGMIRAGGLEVALLRRTGELTKARQQLSYWQEADPPNSFLRYESFMLGKDDPTLWSHLAGDPERVLEVVVDYLGLGLYPEALELLERQYPARNVFSEPGAVLPQEYPLIAYYRGYCRELLGSSGQGDFEAASRQSTRFVFPNRPESLVVLQRAVEANPKDANAHFLLGSLHLSGGMSDLAIEEWEKTLNLNPHLPVLHRNLGMTLLHSRGAVEQAAAIFSKGIQTDPTNLDLYLGLDQSYSLLGRAAEARLQALKQYPGPSSIPTLLLHKLILSLVECGRFEEAESLFAGRTFIREEFGTNIREIYLEVQLQKALAYARQGKPREALTVTAKIGHAMPGLGFTQDGLEPFLQSSRTQYLLGEVASLCGDLVAAKDHWLNAAKSHGYRQVYWGYQAAQKLGNYDKEEWQKRLATAIVAARDYIAGSGHFPAGAVLAQGVLLRALGQKEESLQLLQETFLLPDKQMAHYLCRQALQEP